MSTYIVTFFIIIKIRNMIEVFTSFASCIDTQDRVFSGFSISTSSNNKAKKFLSLFLLLVKALLLFFPF